MADRFLVKFRLIIIQYNTNLRTAVSNYYLLSTNIMTTCRKSIPDITLIILHKQCLIFIII